MLFVAFMFINVGSVSLRPLFELAVKLKMNKSLLAVAIISAGGGQATFIFLCRGFVNSVPKELDEAAKMDGCGFFRIYYQIILPMLKPILATIALLSFIVPILIVYCCVRRFFMGGLTAGAVKG